MKKKKKKGLHAELRFCVREEGDLGSRPYGLCGLKATPKKKGYTRP